MILAVVRMAWVIQEVVSVLDTITMLSLLNHSRSALASDAAKTLTTVASIKIPQVAQMSSKETISAALSDIFHILPSFKLASMSL